MDGISEIFISPSSVGYLFAAMVSFITAHRLYRRWVVSQVHATKTFVLALLYLGVTMFMFGFPPFFFSDDPQILGWLNVLANVTLGLFHAYIVKLVFLLRGKSKAAKTFFNMVVVWTMVVTLPINIIYLPHPTFNALGLEFWNYPLPLLLTLSIFTPAVMSFYALTLFQNSPKAENKFTPIMLGVAFLLGGIGSFFVVAGQSTGQLVFGYITLFIGGFTLFLLPFTKVALEP